MTSKWLREDMEYERRVGMEIDGEKRGREFGAEITNRRVYFGKSQTLSRFDEQTNTHLNMGENANLENWREHEAKEMEDLPMEIVDGKKGRDTVQSRVIWGAVGISQRG
ncbi:hypothetical protein J1N35_011590 [Gossypium stocksii]|uniref:Uncharacterized protein n=1 Tax=Gossypium stocksii TaxID=47602 RepID=A0A9D3W3X5_9ROSI|nr:hypothetical protein J1N35_011590 [Gossypium stocksii]